MGTDSRALDACTISTYVRYRLFHLHHHHRHHHHHQHQGWHQSRARTESSPFSRASFSGGGLDSADLGGGGVDGKGGAGRGGRSVNRFCAIAPRRGTVYSTMSRSVMRCHDSWHSGWSHRRANATDAVFLVWGENGQHPWQHQNKKNAMCG